MKMCQSRLLLRSLVLLLFVVVTGCAQRMTAVKPDNAVETANAAELLTIHVSDDSGQLELAANRPLTYTYYKMNGPSKLVVDLAQTLPGNLPSNIEINKGAIKHIDISKHSFGAGVLSRVEVYLNDDAEPLVSTDTADKTRLIVRFAKGAAMASDAAASAFSDRPAKEVGAKSEVVAQSQENSNSAALLPATKSEPVTPTSASPTDKVPNEAGLNVIPPTQSEVTNRLPSQSPVEIAANNTDITVTEKRAETSGVSPHSGLRILRAVTKGGNEIRIEVQAGVESYNSFRLTKPDRLVIDIPNIRSGMSVNSVEINDFGVARARIGSSGEKVRIVFDTQPGNIAPYQIHKVENGLTITFDGKADRPAQPETSAPVTSSGASTAVEAGSGNNSVRSLVPSDKNIVEASSLTKDNPLVKSSQRKSIRDASIIDAIEFKRLQSVSQVIIRVSGKCDEVKPVKTAKGITLTFKNCQIPSKLQRQIDASGFISVVKSITPYPVKVKGVTNTRLLIALRHETPFTLKKERAELILEVQEATKVNSAESVAEPTRSKPAVVEANENRFAEEPLVQEVTAQGRLRPAKKYTGRKVSLEFADADIRKIFQLIAEVSNLNFLVSDDVTGTISLKLVNVPWDQALDVILENKGLGMQREGSIVQIRPRNKMKTLDEEEVERRLAEEKRMEIKTVIFDVNFANIADVEKQFKALMSKRSDASISSDSRTNKVIVVDIAPNIQKMRALLESLDVPEKQVIIEARIVEASSTFTRDLGVQWGLTYRDGSASFANINSVTTSFGGIVSPVLPTDTSGGVATSMSFGKLTSNVQLDLRLSAAATIGQVKIISTPKVLTVNNKAAKISQGQSVPYQTVSAEGTKTEFVEAALTLEVTPHITADGSVSMKIKASNNSVGTGSPPPINKKEATTELVVRNGDTTVIGGIYVDSDTDSDSGVPFLSDIPLLGWLFKSNSKLKTKNELLIFITPRIVS